MTEIVSASVSFISNVSTQEERNIYGTKSCGFGHYPGLDGKVLCATDSTNPCVLNVPGENNIILYFKTREDMDLQNVKLIISGYRITDDGKKQRNFPSTPITQIKNMKNEQFYDENLPKNSSYLVVFKFDPEKFGYKVGYEGTLEIEFDLRYGPRDVSPHCFQVQYEAREPVKVVTQKKPSSLFQFNFNVNVGLGK